MTNPYSVNGESRQARRFWSRGIVLLACLCAVVLVGVMLARELRTSTLQARYLAAQARRLTYHLESGPSASIRFPTVGPYDERLGYVRLPTFLDRLRAQHYTVAAQARLSPRLQQLIDWGLFPIYDEKMQAGLRIVDRHDEVVFAAPYPTRIYTHFEAIPPLIVHTLLFIENRELLDPRYPRRNPAVEWDRLARAGLDAMIQVVKKNHPTAGGSTLATQIEKFRHSPGGYTDSAAAKLQQIVSASLRAYRHGEKTLASQRQIILHYLNALPLAAQDGHGEVHSLGDGLWAWYRADFAHVNHLLIRPETEHHAVSLEVYARAYRQVLSLLVAHRRPSFYLRQQPEALVARTDRYLRLLSQAGLISPTLRDAALQVRLRIHQSAPPSPQVSFSQRKAANVMRNALMSLLHVPGLYQLDRLDLTARSTLDQERQHAVTTQLHQWHSSDAVQAAGLTGEDLLGTHVEAAKVRYSLVLYERDGQVNLLRIHTDNLDQPFDVNQGLKLDLGSTAKLRTLILYLEIVAALHDRYANLPRQERDTVPVHPSDRLTQWALAYLRDTDHSSLLRMLDAAMERRYSASPAERFFTGGGLHTFANFRKKDDKRVLSVREAFRRSVNLVFIRMMRDMTWYYMARLPDAGGAKPGMRPPPQTQEAWIEGATDARRRAVQRFSQQYAGKRPEAIVDRLMASVHPTPQRFATIYGALEPHASREAFTSFLRSRFPHPGLTDILLQALFTRFVAAPLTWRDRGRFTAMHPLELWVAAYVYRHPGAGRHEIMAASAKIHEPMVLSQGAPAQPLDKPTFTRLEKEAFQDIHKAWQRLGYPFASLVPSYATAIGSSADRPDALAELMGIIVSNGMRYPYRHITQLHFASGTPYETLVVPHDTAQQVLHPAIATVVKEALFGVVEQGTAWRLQGVFTRSNGRAMRVGGKTGTGDHRYETYGPGGQVLQSQVRNRAAALVFMIEDRFFGTLTVYVPGPEAAEYRFTSALAVQALKLLAPTLQPLLQGMTFQSK